MMPSTPRRFYVATGTSRYPEGYPSLPVESDLLLIAAVFKKLGYQNALPELSLNPSRDGMINAIENWLRQKEAKGEVIFYYSGHGETQDRHYLALAEGECATEDIFRVFAKYPVPRALLIFDTC